jgi:hypothetical protein
MYKSSFLPLPGKNDFPFTFLEEGTSTLSLLLLFVP